MEPRDVTVEPGAAVEARDGRLGMVDEVVVRPETGELAYLVIRRGWSGEQLTIPADLIADIPSAREVRLDVTRDEARRLARELPTDDIAYQEGDELRIPLVEERLVAETRVVDLGELRVHKRVETSEEVIRQPVTRDDLEVIRQPVGEYIDQPAVTREEDEWLVIPIMEEVLVVEKRLMLKEELRIRRRQITEEQEIRETVRRERVEMEDDTATGVRGLDSSLTLPHQPIQPHDDVTRPIAPYQRDEEGVDR